MTKKKMSHNLHKMHAYLPVQSSSILPNCALRQSFTHNSISCRDKLSDVTFVEYTFTAIVDLSLSFFYVFLASFLQMLAYSFKRWTLALFRWLVFALLNEFNTWNDWRRMEFFKCMFKQIQSAG